MNRMCEVYNFGDVWEIHTTKNGAFEGEKDQILGFCHSNVGISLDEISMALEFMERRHHNAVRFNTTRQLMGTFNKSNPRRYK